jgi:hypothetical protein
MQVKETAGGRLEIALLALEISGARHEQSALMAKLWTKRDVA